MDPNETLRQLVSALEEGDVRESMEMLSYLLCWLSSGGFVPSNANSQAERLTDLLDSNVFCAEEYPVGKYTHAVGDKLRKEKLVKLLQLLPAFEMRRHELIDSLRTSGDFEEEAIELLNEYTDPDRYWDLVDGAIVLESDV